MGGITSTGFDRDTFDDILTRLETRMRSTLNAPRLNVRDPKGALASIVHPFADEIALVWEVLEAIHFALDPNNSTGQTYGAVAALRGVLRKLATVGVHAGMTFSFNDAVAGTIERGDVRFHPEDDPDNVWINSEAFLVGSSGDYVVATESEGTGSDKTFEQGVTAVILAGPAELTGIAVPTDAIGGTDLETEVAWRARSDAGLQAQGTSPVDALTAEIEEIPGVVNARVIETPGHIQVIVADGGGDADDDAIAQAIWDGKAAGVIPVADGATSGTATDDFGEDHVIPFDRATEIPVYIVVTVYAPEGASVTEIKSALAAAMPTRSGASVVWAKLLAGVAGVAGVEDVTNFRIGTSPAPTGQTNIPIAQTALATLDPDDVSVTVTT